MWYNNDEILSPKGDVQHFAQKHTSCFVQATDKHGFSCLLLNFKRRFSGASGRWLC
jgi:hypothetical protein